MLDIDIPMASNIKTANSYTLLFNRIAALHPGLGITQATHFVKTIKQLPTATRPWRSVAVIGKRDDAMWEQRFRYDRYPVSRYLTNPLFTTAELPVVQGLDELNLLNFLTEKYNMGFHPRDFSVQAAGISYCGGEVRPNWRIVCMDGSPLWYSDQVIWLHGGTPVVDPNPPTGLTTVTEWNIPLSDPYANLIAGDANVYTDFYYKANGLFSNLRASLDLSISGGYTVDYGVATTPVLLDHIPQSLGAGITKYDEWYDNDADGNQYDLMNQGSNNGWVGIWSDMFKGRNGYYASWSTYNDNPPIGTPVEFEGVSAKTADFNGSLPFIVTRQPFMVEAGFRPAASIPGGSTWVDNMGLPGIIGCFFGTDSPNLTFSGPLAGFTGVVKRGQYGKRVAELQLADIRCGIMYRNGVGQVIINGEVVHERTVAFGSDMFLSATFDFVTVGSDNVSYVGVTGMQAALAAGKITAPFKNIQARCKTADIHMGGTSTYKAIKDGLFVTRTRTGYNTATDVADATPNPRRPFSMADSVFYTVSDCVCTSPLYGIRSWVETSENYDKELMVSRVITP